MQTKINKLPQSQISIDFELSSEEFEVFEKKALSEIKKDLEVDGFRKGNAPDDVVLKHAGEEKILTEAANAAIQDSFIKAVKEHKLEVISKPEATIVKVAKGNPFQFKITAYIIPDIELPDYKEIAGEIKKKEASVNDSEMEETLKWLQKSRSKFTLKNAPAEKGDFVEIEYFLSGGEKYNDAFILGEGRFLPGFEEALYQMKDGEEKEGIKTKTKDEKEVSAKIKVLAVKKMEIPELTDDFAKSLGEFKDMSSLKENIRGGLLKEKENAEQQRIRGEIIKKITEKSKLEIPKVLKEREEKAISENFKKKIKENLNISFEEYLEKNKKNKEEMEESFSAEAEKRIKGLLILREIRKKENIRATEEEIKEGIEKITKQYQDPKEINMDPEELKSYAEEMVINEKTFNFLENCVK